MNAICPDCQTAYVFDDSYRCDECNARMDEDYREEEAEYEAMISRQELDHIAMLDAIDAEREEREAYLSGAIESVGDFSY